MEKQLSHIIDEIQKAVVGKQEVIEKILMAILSDGHILMTISPASERRPWP